MKKYGEWRYTSTILDLLTRCKTVVSTHYIGGWLGLRAGLDIVENRNSLPITGIEPHRLLITRLILILRSFGL
jgi:hypothetical protein